MTASPRKPLKNISDKRLKSLGGKAPFSSISKRSESPRKRNPKRKASELKRCYGSKERVLFVKGLPCLAPWCSNATPTENAHIEGDGMGRKAAYTKIAPLCQLHHLKLHDIGRDCFEKTYLVCLEDEARYTEKLWLASRIPERER